MKDRLQMMSNFEIDDYAFKEDRTLIKIQISDVYRHISDQSDLRFSDSHFRMNFVMIDVILIRSVSS